MLRMLKLNGVRGLPSKYENFGSPKFLQKNHVDQRLKEKIVCYLNKGEILFALLESLDCKFGCALRDSVIYNRELTDGEWVWSHEIIHYVSDHNLDLPVEFIDHIKKNNFKISISADKLELISHVRDQFPMDRDLCQISYDIWNKWLEDKGEKAFLSGKKIGLVRKESRSEPKDDVDLMDLL